MTDEQQKIKDYYTQNLKATEYLEKIMLVWKNLPGTFRYMLKFLHEVFQSGQFKGSKLLEIGSGATVHSVASASAYFPNIVLSDYVENNLEHLKYWLKGGDSLSKHFLDIPAGLEGYGNDIESGIKMLESRIRKCVKRVSRCDLLTDGILQGATNSSETAPPFDVALSCLCLETAPKDFDAYVNILKRINKLLRSGGGLIACGFIQGGVWVVENKGFHHIKFDEKDLVDALVRAGFGNICLKTIRSEREDYEYKYEKLYCMTAVKL